jgi:hypothetical protein
MLAKLSILQFFVRLFPARVIRYSSYALMFITIGYSVGSFFAILFQCVPVMWPSKYGTSSQKFKVSITLLPTSSND